MNIDDLVGLSVALEVQVDYTGDVDCVGKFLWTLTLVDEGLKVVQRHRIEVRLWIKTVLAEHRQLGQVFLQLPNVIRILLYLTGLCCITTKQIYIVYIFDVFIYSLVLYLSEYSYF